LEKMGAAKISTKNLTIPKAIDKIKAKGDLML
jgi:hypothetical protein